MGWNTGFSWVTDINKGCSLLMVLKLNVWRGICSVVRLDINILIGTSVWGLDGAKNSTEKPHLPHLFLEWHEISRSGIFSYGPKCKNAKIGQNWVFFVEKHAVYTKFWKYIPILWHICFLVDVVQEKNYKKLIINIHFNKILYFFKFFF